MTAQDWVYVRQANGLYTIPIEDGDFKTTEGLDTAIDMSLFIDGRADASEVSQPNLRRGSIVNEQNEDPDDNIGSTLWVVIEQGRTNQETLNNAISKVNECLGWMLEDQLIVDLNVSGTIVSSDKFLITIRFTKPNNTVFEKQFELWLNTTLEGDNKT